MTPTEADRRAQALAARFAHIAATRMAGVALCHPRLQVAAVGFRPDAAGGAWGVLLTPWFMNLVWLPDAGEAAPLPPGSTRRRVLGRECFEMVGAFEDGVGAFEACSLFSPMHEFADQAAALATADAALQHLRPELAAAPASPLATRRRLLLGLGRSLA
jgi:[NiFe] hydrogenase assembly HybE family chaperone